MIVILGGGPAGRTAALHLAKAGREVLLAERGGPSAIGGQCLNYGCMAICGLSDVARTLTASRTMAGLGIFDGTLDLDFPRLLHELRTVQDTIARVLDTETRDAGVTIRYHTTATFDGISARLDGTAVEAEAVLIAAGSRPAIPDIPGIGLTGVYTPHTLARMPALPGQLAIIGGGVMAAEFAHVFRSFGTEVHVICRNLFLKDLDPALRTCAVRDLDGTHIHENARVRAVTGENHAESIEIGEYGGVNVLHPDAVLIAAGLIPRSEGFTGLEKGARGQIVVNNRMQTSVTGVYAAGDITGPPCLTPVARREGFVAAENILGKESIMDYSAIPQSLSLRHELAFCRVPAEGAVTLRMPGPAGPGTFWDVPSGNTGVSSISFDPSDGRLTGVAGSGPCAGSITSYLGHMIRHGARVDDYAGFLEVHPEADGYYVLLKYASAYRKQSR